jgi:hypothetical protein
LRGVYPSGEIRHPRQPTGCGGAISSRSASVRNAAPNGA